MSATLVGGVVIDCRYTEIDDKSLRFIRGTPGNRYCSPRNHRFSAILFLFDVKSLTVKIGVHLTEKRLEKLQVKNVQSMISS
ncbi:unnamed protein product [Cylicostephanus goldi]|uniref:Uncharacterized protein n=1 Tax=Cylicostephanus goldi TaxID=71465 RepID=A0A3P7N7F5_CYLGO|nr:unnamed protein product [Cylicostephanus goldi]